MDKKNDNKEEINLCLGNLNKKDDIKEEAELNLRNLEKKDDNINNQKNDKKEEIGTKKEVIDINISQHENTIENNKKIESQKNVRKLVEERIPNKIMEGNNIQKRRESLEIIKRGNSQQIILSSEIILNLNEDIKNGNLINTDHNINNNQELRKCNNKIINDIEVIGIKINKNEKYINFKNENKTYKRENEKPIKSKIFRSKKNNNNNINKAKNIYKNNNQILFPIEKSNNVLNQKKYRLSNKPKMILGTEIKYNKNRSDFKTSNKKNIYKKEKLPEKNLRKDSSHNTNYSSRNTNNKLIFTKSKPELDKKIIAKKDHSNLKKKSPNKIFNITNSKNKNNFISTATDFKLKNFTVNSSLNCKSTKNVKKINLQSKFDKIGINKIEDKKEDKTNEKIRLSLNIKDSISKNNKSPSNKNNLNKKYNNKNILINNDYSSLLPQKKKGFNNINTINNNILKSIIDVKKNKNNLKNQFIAHETHKKYNKSITNNNTLDKKFETKNNEII